MKLIAFVDDDEANRVSTSFFLKLHGFEVKTFERGELFLLASPSSFDCIILDMHMPGMDGLAVLRALSCLEHVPPVLVLTGNGSGSAAAAAIALGALDILEKPTEAPVLIEALKRALEANASGDVRKSNPPARS